MSDHLSSAAIIWRDAQTPLSVEYDDIYFNPEDALAESQYVFLQGNQLPARWQNWSQPTFTIGETGFGSGLNFLLSWQLFQAFRAANPTHPLRHLQFVSVEKYPLTLADVQQIHQAYPELAAPAQQLQQQWLTTKVGLHQASFDAVCLRVYLGEVADYAAALQQATITVDAWFFDGFAPAKNPAMWHTDLFTDLVGLSSEQATFATFTAAGQVQRNLRQAGFIVNKRRGFGRKREMLVGQKAV